VVILGGGIQGCATAYFLAQRGVPSTIVERVEIAAAASGKAGGFLAGGWGDGGVTQELHRVSFALHETLAETLGLTTYRKIPTLSVAGGASLSDQKPPVSWLDGDVARAELMDENTAQVTPAELVRRMHEESQKLPGARTGARRRVHRRRVRRRKSSNRRRRASRVFKRNRAHCMRRRGGGDGAVERTS
jgi:glycine/D-amino acid oxidase-like deaminating enzyme